MKRPLFDCDHRDFVAWCDERGEPGFRSRQIRRWIAARRATTFAEMTDLPKPLRLALDRDWTLFTTSVVTESTDADRTRKLLLRLADGERVECVLMAEQARHTICLSTQVGCGMGCRFCASGLDGLVRDLTAGEMIEQMLWTQRLLPPNGRLSHMVVMGIGEPLANLESLLVALDFATGEDGLGISARRVTISTVGLPARIVALAHSGRPYGLAVSLHASNDELRREIVPTAKNIRLRELLAACDLYRKTTKRQVTFEYALLAGVNDRPQHAGQLATLLDGRDALVNLIPYNSVPGLPFTTPSSESTNQFASILRRNGLTVKIRKRKGAGIEAACGQLRRAESASAPLETVQSLRSARTGEGRSVNQTHE